MTLAATSQRYNTPYVGHHAPLPPLTWSDIIEHRDYLIRFAKRYLRDGSLAEDVVHDVFEAVISGRAQFAGRAALRSWLTAILKYKIIDEIRQRVRVESWCDIEPQDTDDVSLQLECPQAQPDVVAEHRELLQQTIARIEQLPPALRDVMQLRVLHEESSDDVCNRLKISASSLFVRLHRARKQLLN